MKYGAEDSKRLGFPDIDRLFGDKGARIHFIGVGGVSVFSLARLSIELGAYVSGSDIEYTPRLGELELLGARITVGHSPDSVRGAALVVFSHAIAEDNSERREAQRLSIPTCNRAEYLGALMLRYNRRIGVSGSHGKSTATAMLDCIFSRAGLLPTTLSGAELPIGEPYRIGGRDILIYEACEYRDSFLSFSPTDLIALNLELDHTDYFKDIEQLRRSFATAMAGADRLFINGDDTQLCELAEKINKPAVRFGFYEQNDYRFSPTSFGGGSVDFTLSRFGSRVGVFRLSIPGAFNLCNAAAAITVALEYGIDIDTVGESVASFSGIPRRLEYIGRRYGRAVYYDYAHHPTEILAGIRALRELGHTPLTVIFKPHTFSRTEAMWRELISALSSADYIILTDIYPAREQPIEGVTSARLAANIGARAKYCTDSEIFEYLDLHTEGAIVLMGAGDYKEIRRNIAKGH